MPGMYRVKITHIFSGLAILREQYLLGLIFTLLFLTEILFLTFPFDSFVGVMTEAEEEDECHSFV
jgi:hypothetical protein